MKKRRLLLTALAVPALAAPRVHAAPGDTPQDDPVVKARTSRALAQGIDERDLPPVPRSLVEPPPLPPPETHPKDMPGYRAKHRRGHRHGKAKARPHRAARHK
ncbi:MAG TPA: hypothetical protein VFF76_11015 [Holophagaceae bacterium]|jgi:hypothetical protein|nr:hypothetical protein [Holophagaceae bacterium]